MLHGRCVLECAGSFLGKAFWRRLALAVIMCALVVSLWQNLALPPSDAGYFRVYDDAYISFRFADNLRLGHGLVYNSGGERVEGYSNFLLVALMALAGMLGVPALSTALVINLFALVATFALVWWAGRRAPLFTGCLLLILAHFAPLLSACRSGLETLLYGFELACVCWALQRRTPKRLCLGSLICALLALTRPESLLFFPALTALLLLHKDSSANSFRTVLYYWVVPCLLLVGAYYCWKWSYFGALLPNTYHAKKAMCFPDVYFQVSFGHYAMTRFFNEVPVIALWLFPFFWAAMRRIALRKSDFILFALCVLVFLLVRADVGPFGRPSAFMLFSPFIVLLIGRLPWGLALVFSCVVLQLMTNILVGSDWPHFIGLHRFFVPLVPLCVWGCAEAMSDMLPKADWRRSVICASLLVVSLWLTGNDLPLLRNERLMHPTQTARVFEPGGFIVPHFPLFADPEKLLRRTALYFKPRTYEDTFDIWAARWINSHTASGTDVATIQAGMFGYYVEREFYDLFGIVTRESARLSWGSRDLASLVAKRRPALVLIYQQQSETSHHHYRILSPAFFAANGYTPWTVLESKRGDFRFYIFSRDKTEAVEQAAAPQRRFPYGVDGAFFPAQRMFTWWR